MAERFKLIPAVYLVLRREPGEVLMHLRANTGYMDGRYGLVSGHLEGDETATSAMIREAAEEAGIIVDPADLRFVHLAHRLNRDNPDNPYQERVDIFFECSRWQGEIRNMEPDKCAGVEWHPLNSLPSNTVSLISRVISDVADGKYYSEYPEEPK